LKLEAYTKVNETAKISGVALIPRISRNNNLYTKAELERFDGVEVPLNWEHNPGQVIGTATFHYNPSLETVYYEGEITNEGAASLARNKTLFTSIEANPQDLREICNGPGDCFSMPYGLNPVGLALTETPGVPETTVNVMERYIEECNHHNPLEVGQDYTKMTKSIDQILNHLNIEACPDCGELHAKKND
jgi:hypothetical protein|tara:strand:- start:131 stop:700 length:570 start_codon:yes stop_codon:yes gene_type:complete